MTVLSAIRNDFTKCQIVAIIPKTYVTKNVIKDTKISHDCYCKNKVHDGIASSYFKGQNLGSSSKNFRLQG